MRKFILLLLLCILLSSCGSELHYLPAESAGSVDSGYAYTPSDDRPISSGSTESMPWYLQYADGYLFIYGTIGSGIPAADNTGLVYTLKRINPETGIVTEVCPDPLCSHNTSDCPFYGLDTLPVGFADGKIFYRRSWITGVDGEAGTVDYYSADVVYDTVSGKLTELINLNGEGGGIVSELYTDTHRYWYVWQWDKNDPDTGAYYLTRAAYDTLKTEFLAEISFDEARFVGYADDTLYFTNGRVLYATDKQFENRRDIAEANLRYGSCFFGGDSVYFINDDDRVFRILLTTGEMTDLGIRAETMAVTENYIYYTSPEEVVLGKAQIYGYAADKVIVTGEHIYRCARDGSGSEKIFTFDGELSATRLIGFEVVGNYIWSTYLRWDDPEGDGIFTDGAQYESSDDGRILRIDVTTAEILEISLN